MTENLECLPNYPSTHASQAISGAVVTKFQRPIGFPSKITWCIHPGRPLDAISSVLLRSGLGIFPIQTRSDVVMSKRPYSELVEFFTTGYPLDVDACFRTYNLPTCRTLKKIISIKKNFCYYTIYYMYVALPFSLDAVPELVVLNVAAMYNLRMRKNPRTSSNVPYESHLSVNQLQSNEVILQ